MPRVGPKRDPAATPGGLRGPAGNRGVPGPGVCVLRTGTPGEAILSDPPDLAVILLKRCKYLAAKIVDLLVGLLCRLGLIRTSSAVPVLRSGSKVALIALDQLGDAVLATPAVEALKSRFPFVVITVIARGSNQAVFEHNPHISTMVLDDAPWWSGRPVVGSLRPAYWLQYLRRVQRLRAERYDVVIDLRGDLRHLLLFGVAVRPNCLLGYSGYRRKTAAQCPGPVAA